MQSRMSRNVIKRSVCQLVISLVLMIPLLAGAGGAWGCSREYSQASPDEVLQSARAMVDNGDVHRLPELIYADTRELRQLLTQFGKVLASLQSLAIELHRAFPDEVGKIKADAEEAAQRGDASGFLGRMMGQRSPVQVRGRRSRQGVEVGASTGDMRQSFDMAMKELFADPYGWLERSEGRITTQYVADDLSAILWDEKPAFGVGLLMKEEGGKWYIMLPSGLPGMGQLTPNSEETWKIAGALAQALDNAIKDTQREVRSGKHASMEDLARSVGEKAAIPALAIMYAYQRATQNARREERERLRQEREAAQQPPVNPPPTGS